MIKKGFIKDYCKANNITIKDMSSATGINVNTLYFYNQLYRTPSKKNIKIISDFTNNKISIDELLLISNNRED